MCSKPGCDRGFVNNIFPVYTSYKMNYTLLNWMSYGHQFYTSVHAELCKTYGYHMSASFSPILLPRMVLKQKKQYIRTHTYLYGTQYGTHKVIHGPCTVPIQKSLWKHTIKNTVPYGPTQVQFAYL